MPAVYLVAMLRYYQEPWLAEHHDGDGLREAKTERQRLEATMQYRRGMERLSQKLADLPVDF